MDAYLRAIYYVDGFNSGGNDDDSAYMLYKKAKLRLAEGGGFNLRKFVTNSPGLMEKIERNESTLSSKLAKDISTSHNSEQPDAVDEDEIYSKITLATEPTTSESEQQVLGVNWNFVEDQHVFDIKLDTDDLTRRMRHLSNVMNHFWSRWRNEYLMVLRDSHRVEKRNGNETVSLGDIVVVHEESRPRGLWRLGKVEGLISGADGQTRGAIVKVFSRKGR